MKSYSAVQAIVLSWKLLTPAERRRSILLAVFQTFASLVDILALLAVMPLIGIIIEPDSINTNSAIRTLHHLVGEPEYGSFIILLGCVVLFLLSLSIAANFLNHVLVKRFCVACQKRLASDIMSSCVNAPYIWFLGQKGTELASHVYEDVLIWSNYGIQKIVTITAHASLLILAASALISFAVFEGIVGLIFVGLSVVIIMVGIRSRIRKLTASSRVASARTLHLANQIMSGIKDIKLSARGSFFIHLFTRALNDYGNAMGNLKILSAVPSMAMMFLGQLGLVVIAIFLWSIGNTSGAIASQMAFVLLITSRAIPATIRLSSEIEAMWKVIPHVNGIHRLYQETLRQTVPGAVSTSVSLPPVPLDWQRIELSGVWFSYKSSPKVALERVSLTVERGWSYGIVGPSGCGKTTLIDLILGLLEPSEGQILLDGKPLETFDLGSWHKRIGYVPQTPLILDDTLLANVAFGLVASKVNTAWALRCLEMASLRDVVSTIGLEGKVGDGANRLSGGQRQRVAMARALYDKPDLLVLDEATNALDAVSEQAVRDSIETLRGKVTILTVAHRMTAVQQCDEIFLLEEGRLVARGTHATLKGSNPLYQRMVLAARDERV